MKQQYLLILILLVSNKLFSQPGTLDLSFGNKGKVSSTTQTGLPAEANAVIVKDDGKILVGSGEYISDKKVFLQKQFLTDGTPDLSFGKDGELRTDFGNDIGGGITAMAATRDNNIIAAGIGGLDAFNNRGADILLAKYDKSGKLDSAFGINGLVVADFGLFEYANCMKLLSNDKILVAGSCRKRNVNSKNNCLIARFNADGSLDRTFGDNGKVITDAGSTYGSVINSIAITADRSIIAAGKAENLYGSIYNKILLAKYTADGKLITDFGVNGFVFTDLSEGQDFANAVAVQDDGKIVAAGVTGAYSAKAGMCIARYNENGNPDSSFNGTGVRIIYFGEDNAWAQSLLIQKDKSFLLGGFKFDNAANGHYDFALVSVMQDGSLNSSFGNEGMVTTDFSGFTDYCDAIALQPDGKIIAAGGSSDELNNISYVSLARYTNDKGTSGIIAKIRRWLQHHNGFTWDAGNYISSYVVQRSNDGMHWSAVNRQQATTDNKQPAANSLYYNDPSPLSGTNFYRLQTTGTDGLVNYSNVLAVTPNDNAIRLSPNPATNSLHIEGLSAGKVEITVIDFTGRIVFNIQPYAFSHVYNLNITALKRGNYLLKIEMNDEVITKKFVKK